MGKTGGEVASLSLYKGRGTKGEGFFLKGRRAGIDKYRGRVVVNTIDLPLYQTLLTPLFLLIEKAILFSI